MSQTDVNRPVYKTFMGRQFIHGGGVAIFHVASARVVVVHHTKENHYFLPKGRRDIGEDSVAGAEREGFEEVCKASPSLCSSSFMLVDSFLPSVICSIKRG